MLKKLLVFILFFGVLLTGCEYFEQPDNKTYISFDTYGAGQIEKVALAEFVELPTPVKEGYTFSGWYYERTFETEATLDNIILITASTSLYAKWEPEIEHFTVMFVDHDGTILQSSSIAKNGFATAPATPSRTGYTFTGWDQSFDTITVDITIQALYDVNVYTVRFVDNDGMLLKSERVEYLSPATPPSAPQKDNFRFIGWDQNYDEITESVEIMAVYESTNVIVTYDTAGGSIVASQELAYGAVIHLPTPTKSGYILTGWTYNGTPLTATRAYEDMTLVAVWALPGNYIITFNSKGGSSVASMNVENFQVLTSLPTPTKSGGTFLHWICEGFIVTTPKVFDYQKNVTFEAVYTTLYYSAGSTVSYRNRTEKVMIPDTYAQREDEFRGVWVSFITNDLGKFQSEEQMKAQLNDILDNMVAWNMNALVFHVRTHNNAYFDTDRDPQSSYTASVDYDTWDYLEWLIDECHKRNIEFHAWLNPYRLTTSTDANAIAANYASYPQNPASDPANILVGTGSSILNPGEPVVRDYLVDVCMEVIEKYDVDAIHFDDYFYISMASNADLVTYNKYKANSQTTNISDWRREQVDLFIHDLSNHMRQYNEVTGRSVELGISPSGIWRNGTGSHAITYDQNGTAITNGSNTAGMEHYGGYLYSDTKKWVDMEWIDYVAPQTYWSFTQTVAQYAELADWWSAVVKNKKAKLYLGMGIYMTSYGWGNNPYEASDQVLYNTKHPEIDGVCIFRYGYIKIRLNENNAGALRLMNEYWLNKVEIPE